MTQNPLLMGDCNKTNKAITKLKTKQNIKDEMLVYYIMPGLHSRTRRLFILDWNGPTDLDMTADGTRGEFFLLARVPCPPTVGVGIKSRSSKHETPLSAVDTWLLLLVLRLLLPPPALLELNEGRLSN